MEELKDRLRWARERAGFKSASDAARHLRVSEPTYLGHENGSRGAVRNIQKYARAFRVNPVWLLTGNGEPTGSKIEQIYTHLPPEDQKQLLDYAEFLERRRTS